MSTSGPARSSLSAPSRSSVAGRIADNVLRSTLPRLTALPIARAKIDRERWLAKARGVTSRFKIADSDPMVALRFNDHGPRVSAAMDYGFGDLL